MTESEEVENVAETGHESKAESAEFASLLRSCSTFSSLVPTFSLDSSALELGL